MGCSESHLTSAAQKNLDQNQQIAENVPAVIEEDAFEIQQVTNNHKKLLQKSSFNPTEEVLKTKENEAIGMQDNQDNKIKVKKARNYIIRPQHERFIENILQTNRTKAITEFPVTPNKSAMTTLKKNATSLHSKPQESKDKQNMEEIKQKPQKSMTSPIVDGKYSKKQHERLMNNILLGKLNQQELNQIGERIDLEQFDSNATLRL